MFNIDTDKLVEMLLSPRLFTATLVAMLKSILEPAKWLIDKINIFRNNTITKMSYNGQVCSLERLLNDNFDAENRDIYITDAPSIQMLVAYQQEDTPRRIIVAPADDFANYPVIAYQRSVVGENLHNFIINIPDSNEVRARENELKAIVTRYKLANKGFYLK